MGLVILWDEVVGKHMFISVRWEGNVGSSKNKTKEAKSG